MATDFTPNQLDQKSYTQARRAMQRESGSVDSYINEADETFNLAKAKRSGAVVLHKGYTVWDVSEAVYRATHGIGQDVILDNNAQAQEEVGKIFESILAANDHISETNFTKLQPGTQVNLADTLKEYIATLGEADGQEQYRMDTGDSKTEILKKVRTLLDVPEQVTDQELETALRAQDSVPNEGNLAGSVFKVKPLQEAVQVIADRKAREAQQQLEETAERERQAKLEETRKAHDERASTHLGRFWKEDGRNDFARFGDGRMHTFGEVEAFTNHAMNGKERLTFEEFKNSPLIQGLVDDNFDFSDETVARNLFNTAAQQDGDGNTISRAEMASLIMFLDQSDQPSGMITFDGKFQKHGLRSVYEAFKNQADGQPAMVLFGGRPTFNVSEELKGTYTRYWEGLNMSRGLNAKDAALLPDGQLDRPRLEGKTTADAVATTRILLDLDANQYSDADIEKALTAYADGDSLQGLSLRRDKFMEALQASHADRLKAEYVENLSGTEAEAKGIYDDLQGDTGQYRFFHDRVIKHAERPESYYEEAEALTAVLATEQGKDATVGDTFRERFLTTQGMTLQEFKSSTFASILRQQGISEDKLDEIFGHIASADGNSSRASAAELTAFTLFMDNINSSGDINTNAGVLNSVDIQKLKRMPDMGQRIKNEFLRYSRYLNPSSADESRDAAATVMQGRASRKIGYGNMRNYAPGSTSPSEDSTFQKALQYAKTFIQKMDTDKSGTLSKEEFTADHAGFTMPGILYGGGRDKLFEAIARADGEIDAIEFAAWNMVADGQQNFDGSVSEQEISIARNKARENSEQFRTTFNERVSDLEEYVSFADRGSIYREVNSRDGMTFFSEGQVQWMGGGTLNEQTPDYVEHTLNLGVHLIERGGDPESMTMSLDDFKSSQLGQLLKESGMNDKTLNGIFNAMDQLDGSKQGKIGPEELASFLIHVDKIGTSWGRRGDGTIIPGDGVISREKLARMNANFRNRLFPRRPEVLFGPLQGVYEGLDESRQMGRR